MRSAVGLVLVLVTALLTGCGAADQPSRSYYRPMSDSALFDQIKHLPGVISSDLTWTDTFTSSRTYGGQITVARGTDPRKVLDQALAVLWQGRPSATYAVMVGVNGSVSVDPTSLGLSAPDSYLARYGRHPGDGEPPASLPPEPD